MNKVSAPTVNDAELLDSIIEAKEQPYKAHLQSVRNVTVMEYDNYTQHAPQFSSLASVTVTGDQKGALHHAYSSETVPLKELRSKLLREPCSPICPFCGLGESSTLDHFLPKDLEPQFSVFSKNLVPCCSYCNTLKGKKFRDPMSGIRMFLHPYFDIYPSGRFVSLDIDIDTINNAIYLDFSLKRSAFSNVNTYDSLLKQFDELNLKNRYMLQSLSILKSIHSSLRECYEIDNNYKDVSRELSGLARYSKIRNGDNHFETILFENLSDNRQFCDGGFEIIDY